LADRNPLILFVAYFFVTVYTLHAHFDNQDNFISAI